MQENRPRLSQSLLSEYRTKSFSMIKEHGGKVIREYSDLYCAQFPSAVQAAEAAWEIQRNNLDKKSVTQFSLPVRMAIHVGAAEGRRGNFLGATMTRLSHLLDAAHGGQVLLSNAAASAVDRLPDAATLRDLGLHHLRDLGEAEHIFQLIDPKIPFDTSPIRSLGRLPQNLPLPTTSFVGREKELNELSVILESRRLVVLIGPGGSGKTRLAIQLGARALDRYRDGVWFVEIPVVQVASLAEQSLAVTLGIREQANIPFSRSIVEFLKPKKMLLILDNCEHVVESCASLVNELLQSCPNLQILATSRQVLGSRSEAVWPVPPLSLPGVKSRGSTEHLLKYPAVRLFVERAAKTQPGFSLMDSNAAWVVKICRRLDGLPLAIEIASTHVGMLSVEEISRVLEDRLGLLKMRSSRKRHRRETLESVFDWSHGLLTEAEQSLFRRLSAFVGGFRMEAVQAICEGGEVPKDSIPSLLEKLVNKSLAVEEKVAEGARYRFLETVREYAAIKLEKTAEFLGVRARHLDYYLALAEKAEENFRGPDQALWYEQVHQEHDNMRVAIEWSQSQYSDVEKGLRLAGALWRFWDRRGYLSEGKSWLAIVLKRTEGRSRTPARVRALRAAGHLWLLTDEFANAQQTYDQALNIARELGDEREVASTLGYLGLAMTYQQKFVEGLPLLQESVACFKKLGDLPGVSSMLGNLALGTMESGDTKLARKYFEEGLRVGEEMGDLSIMGSILSNLGALALEERQWKQAEKFLRKGLEFAKRLDDISVVVQILEETGRLAFLAGNAERGAILFGGADRLRKEKNIPRIPKSYALQYEKVLRDLRSKLKKDRFKMKWENGENMSFEDLTSMAAGEEAKH